MFHDTKILVSKNGFQNSEKKVLRYHKMRIYLKQSQAMWPLNFQISRTCKVRQKSPFWDAIVWVFQEVSLSPKKNKIIFFSLKYFCCKIKITTNKLQVQIRKDHQRLTIKHKKRPKVTKPETRNLETEGSFC